MSACESCLRRSRLLAALAGRLEHLHAQRGMLDEVFALADEDLVAALASSPRERRRLLEARRDPALLGGVESSAAVCRHDAVYPSALAELQGPPSVLFLASERSLREVYETPAVAIVGSRRASPYGLEMARSVGRGLAAAGVTVISGMALGIDSAAHAGALEGRGATLAVLAGGPDVAYPASKRALHGEIRRRGLAMSEFPPGFAPRRWGFPARNRIIAGLAALTVVIEAAERSGALITARVARELGREVGAVPGQVTSPSAAGANALLRDGAQLIDGPQAALDVVFGVGVRRASALRDASELTPRLRVLLDRVRAGETTVGALTGIQGDPGAVIAGLGELELAGYVRRGAGGAYVALP